jgi:hypothetical protein
MKNQFEQVCNAHALEKLGIPVFADLEEYSATLIGSWLKENAKSTHINYPDNARSVIDYLMTHFTAST